MKFDKVLILKYAYIMIIIISSVITYSILIEMYTVGDSNFRLISSVTMILYGFPQLLTYIVVKMKQNTKGFKQKCLFFIKILFSLPGLVIIAVIEVLSSCNPI